MKNKLQTEADEINQKFNGYFLACPGFDKITVIADTKPDITEYQISYPNGIANMGCSYEQKDDKLITKMHVIRDLASGDDKKLEKLIAIAKKYEG